MAGRLRILDAGAVGAVRSQSLWHGISSAMKPDGEPVLSFCTPVQAYVCTGYHRRLDELDLELCRAEGLPVLRRQIGGGPVYLDADQLLFQLTLPSGRAPAGVGRLYRTLLEPAAAAFRALGAEGARLEGLNDIGVGGRKLSGTGAGQIGPGVTVVGNVIFRFPHERMVRVLALPSEEMRRECLRLMRAHVSSFADEGLREVTREDAVAALSEAYSAALGLESRDVGLDAAERAEVERWDQRLADPAWVLGPDLPARPGRQVKVRAGVWVFAGAEADLRVLASVAGGVVECLRVDAAGLNGAGRGLCEAVAGTAAEPAALRAALRRFGAQGERVMRALEPGLELR